MERVTLVLPRQRGFGAVADLVLAGLGTRLDLTLETIDDLQLALESVLGVEERDGDVTVSFEAADGTIVARVGPFGRDAVNAALDGGAPLDLRRVLDTVVDRVAVSERTDGCHVEIHKSIPVAAEAV